MIKAEFKTLKKSRYRIEILKKIETKKKKKLKLLQVLLQKANKLYGKNMIGTTRINKK